MPCQQAALTGRLAASRLVWNASIPRRLIMPQRGQRFLPGLLDTARLPWHNKGMTSTPRTNHRNCTHPATKAARAACRKAMKAFYCDTPEEAAEYLADKALDAARADWEAFAARFAGAHTLSGEINADDTAREEGFEAHTLRWYEVAMMSTQAARDYALANMNHLEPEEGQRIGLRGSDALYWVDQVIWGKGWATEVVLIDEGGNRRRVKVEDLMDEG